MLMSGLKKINQFSNCQKDSQFRVSTLQNDSSSGSDRDDYWNNQIAYQLELNNQIQQVIEQNTYNNGTNKCNDKMSIGNQCNYKMKEGEQNEQENKYIQNQIKQWQKLSERKESGFTTKIKQINSEERQKRQAEFQKKKRKRRQILNLIQKQSNQQLKIRRSSNSLSNNKFSKQLITYNQIIVQKKKQNHSLLKNWNYRRLSWIELYKRTCDQLILNVDKLQKLSLQNFQVYQQFYSQKCQQLQIKVNNKFSFNKQINNNALYRGICNPCIKILNMVRQKQKLQKQLTLNYINIIQTTIIKQIFNNYLNLSYKQFVKQKSTMLGIKQKINQFDKIICQKLILFQNHFTTCLDNYASSNSTSMDFYLMEIEYLSKCEEQIMEYQKLGQMLIKYYKKAVQEEKIRKQCVVKSLQNYVIFNSKFELQMRKLFATSKQKNKQQQQNSSQTKQTQQQQQQQQYKFQQHSQNNATEIYQAYKIQHILSQQLINQILTKSKQNKSRQLTDTNIAIKKQNNAMFLSHNNTLLPFEQLQQFLSSYKISQFICQHLTIKRYKIKIFKQDKWIFGQIIMTVDKFVHVCVFYQKQCSINDRCFYYLPQFTTKIQLLQIILPQDFNQSQQCQSNMGELEVILSENKVERGIQKFLLKNSKKIQFTVRFLSQDDLLEFQSYLDELSNRKKSVC